MEKQPYVISESYYYSPQEKDLYTILESKQEPNGIKSAVIRSINSDCKIVYDYKIVGSSISWLHGIKYSDQQNKNLINLPTQNEHNDITPIFRSGSHKGKR